MNFLVLGPLEVSCDGRSVSIRRGLPRALLIFLLLHRRVPVAAEVIADRLWSGEPPADAANAVQRIVSYVRRALGQEGRDLLVTRPAGYALMVRDGAVDAFQFERLVHDAGERGDQGSADGALRGLAQIDAALKLWRGDPLSDVGQHEWAVAEIVRLEELKIQARALQLDALLLLGRAEEAVGQARALVTEHPLQEQFHSRLVLALYRGGRQGEALSAYAAARRLLDDELGLDPSPQLRALEGQILAQAPDLDWTPPADWSRVGSATTHPADPARPPSPVTTMVGREEALLQLSRTLTTTRVLTLTGAGGVGKTRLALELAHQESQRRVWWIELDVLSEDHLAASAVAQALRVVVAPGTDPVQAVARHISDTAALLVLDGCEQVAHATAALVDRLQRDCPALIQLVTSRRPLRVAGEVTWPVQPLDLPADQAGGAAQALKASSLQLFQQRAAAAQPGFRVDGTNLEDVVAIVRALDGLPLAIELAAAHLDVLPPDGIRQRLSDRFELLQNEQWDASPRQQTLRAVIDSSVALLTGEEREHLRQLAVFVGSFDLEAAEAVTGSASAAAYRLTAALVRQSLVAPVDGGRFRLLESTRAYAWEDLSRTPRLEETQRRHADHLYELMRAADQGLRGREQQKWLSRIRPSVPDLRAALAWTLNGAVPELGARLAAVSTWFWTREGMLDEASGWMAAAAAVPLHDRAARAAVLHAIGRIAAPRGDLQAARDACAASVELSRALADDAALGRALVTLGLCEWALGHLREAAQAHDEAATRAEAADDRWHRDAARILRLRTAIDAGEENVEQRMETVAANLHSTGDQHLIGLALGQQARLGLLSGDPDRAYDSASSSLRFWRAVDYREGEIQALNLQARAAVLAGRPDQAALDARSAILLAMAIGHRGGLLEGMETLAAVRHAAGQDAEALELLNAATRARTDAGIPVPEANRAAVDRLRHDVVDRHGGSTGRATKTPKRDLESILADLQQKT